MHIEQIDQGEELRVNRVPAQMPGRTEPVPPTPSSTADLLLIRYSLEAALLHRPGAGDVDPRFVALSTRAMISTLCYCYGTGVFSSREIERRASIDPVVRYLCSSRQPSWIEVREFRRRHKHSLIACLAEFLLKACPSDYVGTASLSDKQPLPPSLISRPIYERPMEFPYPAAARIVARAVQADSMEMDD